MHGGLTLQKSCCRKALSARNAAVSTSIRKAISWTYGSTAVPLTWLLPQNVRSCPGRLLCTSKAVTSIVLVPVLSADFRCCCRPCPYESVLTHGYVVDGDGRKMSKSVGNVIVPQDVIKQYGADIIRLWTASSDYKADIRISPKILKQLAEVYRKIRNTIRYILGNTNDFNYETDAVPFNEMLELDQWALMHLQLLKKEVTAAYESYDFHVLYHAIHNFCTVEMSSFYLDILKDRLYAYKADSKERRSAQTAMHEILMDLIVMLSPVLSFTMEEVWQFMKKPANAPESVQMLPWPEVKEEYINEELETKWDNFIEIRSEITKVLELARRNKQIGHSLDAKVELHAEGEALAILKSVEKDLATLLIVSQAIIVEGAAEGAEATGREDLKVTVLLPKATSASVAGFTVTRLVRTLSIRLCANAALKQLKIEYKASSLHKVVADIK